MRCGIRTDAYGLIGKKYLDAGWGKRVCQIYAEASSGIREPIRTASSTAFSSMVDTPPRWSSATRNTRCGSPGLGPIIWHDFCPLDEVMRANESTRDVVQSVVSRCDELGKYLSALFWVDPSWLLFGVRAQS